jgi:RNA polymerase sigma-70 factor (ECF subfamily)
MTDAELLESWKTTRDRAVLDSLFARHYPTVYHVVLKLVRNATDAGDLTQSAFLKAVESADTLQPTGSLRNWLLTIAVNEVRQFRRTAARRNRPEHLQELARKGAPAPGQEGEAQRREFEEHLEQILREFPDELKEPLVLHYYQNLSYSEMAGVLAIPKSTVQFRMDQALQKLREEFKKRGAISLFAEFARRPAPSLLVGLTLMKTKTLAVALVLLCCLLPFGAFVWKSVRPARPEPGPTATAPATAATAAAAKATTPISDGSAIFGRVLEKATDAPVAGAIVAVYNVEDDSTDQAVTDERGAFRIASTLGSRATHQLKITHRSYAPLSAPRLEASREPRTFHLSAGGTITGRVEDTDGLPLFPYRIAIARDRFEAKGYDPAHSLYHLALPSSWVLEEPETVYHADGRFEMRHVAPGQMLLLVRMEGTYSFFGPARFSVPDEWPVKVHEGKTTEVRIVRPDRGTLRVKVIDSETREPIPGAQVEPVADVGRHNFTLDQKPILTNELGLCTVPAALYNRENRLNSMALIVGKPGYSSRRFSFGGQENGYLLEVTLGKPARLHGRVQAPDGSPVERAAVYIERPDDGAVVSRAFTDAQGAYAFESLGAPFTYAVHVFDRSLQNSRAFASVVLREGEDRELNFGAAGGTGIKGTVRRKGKPAGNAYVVIDGGDRKSDVTYVHTNPLGEFYVEGLAPRSYEVSIHMESQLTLRRQVTVKAGEWAEAHFDAGALRIRGVAVDAATQKPATKEEYAEIIARRIDGGAMTETASTWAREEGVFEIEVSQPGLYQISLGDSFDFISGAPVQVDLNSRSSVEDVRLLLQRDSRDGVFRVRVLDAATGEPLPDVSFHYQIRNSQGAGGFDAGLIEFTEAGLGRYSGRVSSGRYVEVPVTFELTPANRQLEMTVKLERADAVRIKSLEPSSVAERAGLREGDVLVSYDGAPLTNLEELQACVSARPYSQKVPLVIRRGGESRTLVVPGGLLGIEIEHVLLRR